jgi:tRNA A37 threonylcarbamoyladenosine dehydratase
MELDINLYSRQIGAYGLETMEKLIQKKIYIFGVGGVIIKN